MSDSSGIRAPDCYRGPAYRLTVELPSTKRHFLNHRLNNFPHSFNVNNIPEFFSLFWIRKMGKKRAKKIKEAQRRAELEASFASASGPAGKALRQKFGNNRITINKGEIKYSGLLIDFVDPIINEEDTLSIIKTKYAFAVSVWNAAIIREYDEGAYQKEKRRVASLTDYVNEFSELFEDMAKSKKELFSEYKKIIAHFEIKMIDETEIDVAVGVFEPEEKDGEAVINKA